MKEGRVRAVGNMCEKLSICEGVRDMLHPFELCETY